MEAASTFNARQGVRDQFLPYFDTNFDYAAPNPILAHTSQHFDPLARVVQSINPDQTFTSITYQPLVQVQADEEDNQPASPHANTPKILTFDMVKNADRMITMGCSTEAEAVCPASFIESEDWALEDPKGKSLEQVRKIRDEIKDRVKKLLREVTSS